MIRAVALWLLIGAAICLIPVIAGYLYSGRAALNSPSGTPLYDQTRLSLGYDPLLGYDKDSQ